MMERQLSHMVRLIDDLLDVSRVSSGKLVLKREPVTAQAVVLSAIEASRSFIEAAGHEFELHLPDEALYLDADPTRLAQVVGNLLTNAAKYTPSGGKICLHVRRDADQVVVEVTDTGEGIPAEMIPKVFELFTQVGHTLDRSQGGLGIGLALVKQLVDMHGGTVTAVSRGAGQGSTFSVRLPLDRVRQSPGPNVDALEMETGFPRRRVLVVDDNVDAAESLSMVLKLDGHEVRAAHSGEEAMLLAKEFHPEIAFLDIGLPGLNGYDLARMIRGADELKDVVLVALTGWGSDEDKQKSKAAGFDYHLTKPIETSMMQEVLGQPR
jgi:CheY-like chemotaxis protein/anti-sigma regulatory factor (Ser/Thr protein kinase)